MQARAESPDHGVDAHRAEQHQRHLRRRAKPRGSIHEADGQRDRGEEREQRRQRHAPSPQCDDARDTESEERVVHTERDARGIELLVLDLVDRDLLVRVEESPRPTVAGEHDYRHPGLVVTDVVLHLVAIEASLY